MCSVPYDHAPNDKTVSYFSSEDRMAVSQQGDWQGAIISHGSGFIGLISQAASVCSGEGCFLACRWSSLLLLGTQPALLPICKDADVITGPLLMISSKLNHL